MSSRVVLAEEALAMGLVNRVVPGDQLLDEARAYAYDLATNCSPTSMAVMKRQINHSYGQTLDEAMDEAFGLMNKSLKRADFKEGVASYVQKRPPQFAPITGDL
jgi:enoyl-CoA hydratase/carnithine racemase